MGSLPPRPHSPESRHLPLLEAYAALQRLSRKELSLKKESGKYTLTLWEDDGSYIEVSHKELCECLKQLESRG